ncbi:uncharacterized protein LOC120359265 isoform X1 [Solenopsis invicta]|uniref:uncharacterized protein LOC120359265 isoform X1 n=1 Tax=Solenopsis invicta TaxID=13686 RepID=UPI00193CCBA9|nr:uncharacterized protein LOC120359265 isoform X1 [Solenopsis invicta]
MKIELGLHKKDDLLLARDICRMLLKKKQTSKDVEKPFLRYSNNHDILKEILTLVIRCFISAEENAYISFVTDALNAISCQCDYCVLIKCNWNENIALREFYFNCS